MATTERAARPVGRGWLGGVCQGLAEHLGWSPLVVRLLFVLAASYKLLGVALYLTLWLGLPRRDDELVETPGGDAATRAGLRSATAQSRLVDAGLASAFAALGGGLLWLVEGNGWGLGPAALAPALLAALGLACFWREADRVRRPRNGGEGVKGLLRSVDWSTFATILVGLLALVGAVWLVGVTWAYPDDLSRLLAIIGLSAAAISLAVLPWFVRVRRELAWAKEAKLVSDARADMAAHLHDSVLQTLALIQRRADDPKAVAALARRQERELRSWLYGEPVGAETLLEAVAQAAAEVEADLGVPVEVVGVGEAPFEAGLEPLVAAAREAMANAAKHSGADRVDVYAEAGQTLASVYVRDRGSGFDLAAIAADRAGVEHSIRGRMERAGGRAVIRTAPGEGTEVRLELPL
ncbi:MAG: PspC domain-containing protein [Propionibacteriaceae bacterium]|nr:PspC domain-containing protein [Propionibacteriaceae bacterium]